MNPLVVSTSVNPVENSRILLIDDDKALLEGLAGMLTIRFKGIHVDTCSNPMAAQAVVQSGQYDLILCDVSMPGMNGLALLPHLRYSAPHASIVMMSAVADEGVREYAYSCGATTFIAKPFNREVLTMTLQLLLGNRTERRHGHDLPCREPVSEVMSTPPWKDKPLGKPYRTKH